MVYPKGNAKIIEYYDTGKESTRSAHTLNYCLALVPIQPFDESHFYERRNGFQVLTLLRFHAKMFQPFHENLAQFLTTK